MSRKAGHYRQKKESIQEKHKKQMHGLCASVNRACDEWLRKRGVAPQDWRAQKEREYHSRK
jgi:hypothetical protein